MLCCTEGFLLLSKRFAQLGCPESTTSCCTRSTSSRTKCKALKSHTNLRRRCFISRQFHARLTAFDLVDSLLLEVGKLCLGADTKRHELRCFLSVTANSGNISRIGQQSQPRCWQLEPPAALLGAVRFVSCDACRGSTCGVVKQRGLRKARTAWRRLMLVCSSGAFRAAVGFPTSSLRC